MNLGEDPEPKSGQTRLRICPKTGTLHLGDETITAIVAADQESLGGKTRRLRISEHLTRQKLASIAGVSTEEVALLEENLPVRLDVKRKSPVTPGLSALCG